MIELGQLRVSKTLVPKFVKHAQEFVHLTIPPCYEPDPPEHWTIER